MDAYKIIIVGTLLLALLPAVILGSRGLKWGMLVWVATLALGYRTFSITPKLLIHPAEVVIYGLCLWMLVQRLAKRGASDSSPWVPLWLWPFALAWIWGWWPIVYGDVRWEAMLSEFKNVFLILPLFVVTSVVAKDRHSWRSIILVFYCAGLWIACFGILEYVYPGIKDWLPNFITNPSHIKEEGFQRAAFSFWGSPDAVYMCLLALPFGLCIWQWWRASWARAINAAGMLCLIYAAYLSGHRNAWLVIGVQVCLILLLKKKYYVFGVVALMFVLWYERLPDQARTRIYSGAQLIAGKPLDDDSSGQGRWNRTTASWNHVFERPLGGGWAAAGWVHNDFLQIAENLGLAVGLFFLAAYLFTFQRLLRQVLAMLKVGDPPWLLISVFLSYLAAGVVFATDANVPLTQHIAPLWFIWTTGEILVKQTRPERKLAINAYSGLSAPAYLQLRDDRARHVGIS